MSNLKKVDFKGLIRNEDVLNKIGVDAPDFVKNYLIGSLSVVVEENGKPKYHTFNVALDMDRKELKASVKTKEGYRYIPIGKFDEKGTLNFKLFVDKNLTLNVSNARVSFAKEDNPRYFNANFIEGKKQIDYFNSKVEHTPSQETAINSKIEVYVFTDKAEMTLTESKHNQRGPNGPKVQDKKNFSNSEENISIPFEDLETPF